MTQVTELPFPMSQYYGVSNLYIGGTRWKTVGNAADQCSKKWTNGGVGNVDVTTMSDLISWIIRTHARIWIGHDQCQMTMTVGVGLDGL